MAELDVQIDGADEGEETLIDVTMRGSEPEDGAEANVEARDGAEEGERDERGQLVEGEGAGATPARVTFVEHESPHPRTGHGI